MAGYGQPQLGAYQQQPQQLNYHTDPYSTYGAASPFLAKPSVPRRRVHLTGMCSGLLYPWFIFMFLYGLMSFGDVPVYVAIVLFLVLLIPPALITVAKLLKRIRGDTTQDATWLVFLTVTTLILGIAGIWVGQANWIHNLRPYHDINQLNAYGNVNPSLMRGNQVMDAGRIYFSQGSTLDITKSMGFRNYDVYCVAPIVSPVPPSTNFTANPSFDFWAVGVNCCSSGSNQDYTCGEYTNAEAHAGLRLMKAESQSFFRLAVQQAVAAHNIEARHPMFFQWMKDPREELESYHEDGEAYFYVGIIASFFSQLFLVGVAAIIASKM